MYNGFYAITYVLHQELLLLLLLLLLLGWLPEGEIDHLIASRLRVDKKCFDKQYTGTVYRYILGSVKFIQPFFFEHAIWPKKF